MFLRLLHTWAHSSLVALALLVPLGSAMAEVPATFGYSGYLTAPDGVPVNGDVRLTFRLYSTATGGTPLWQEEHSSVGVDIGRFAVQLGSRVPFFQDGQNVASSVRFDEQLFLSMQVGDDSEMSERMRLNSAPSALTTPARREIVVDCRTSPAESVQAAIDRNHAIANLVIYVRGTCRESIEVRRGGVELRGFNLIEGGEVVDMPQHGFVSVDEHGTAVLARYGGSLFVRNLFVRSAFYSSRDYGVGATDGATVSVFDSVVGTVGSSLDSFWGGVFALRASSAYLYNSRVSGRYEAVGAYNASAARVNDSELSTESESAFAGAIHAHTGAAVELRGEITLRNRATVGKAISALLGSYVSQRSGHVEVTGGINLKEGSTVNLTDSRISAAHLLVRGNSTLRIHKSSVGAQTLQSVSSAVTEGSALVLEDGVGGSTSGTTVSDNSRLILRGGNVLTSAQFPRATCTVSNNSQLAAGWGSEVDCDITVGHGSLIHTVPNYTGPWTRNVYLRGDINVNSRTAMVSVDDDGVVTVVVDGGTVRCRRGGFLVSRSRIVEFESSFSLINGARVEDGCVSP